MQRLLRPSSRFASRPSAFAAALAIATVLSGTALAQDATGTSTDPAASSGADEQMAPDVVAAMREAGGFATLLTALEAADLIDTLQGAGPFTLFAPTDAAFDALPDGIVPTLMLPENRADLIEMLAYHVVPERLDAKRLGDMVDDIGTDPATIDTVDGHTLVVDSQVGLTIDGAEVTRPDMKAGNGIVHGIDTLLLPDAS